MVATPYLWCTKPCIEYKPPSTLANLVGLPKKEDDISNTDGNPFPTFCTQSVFDMEK